MSRPQNTYWMAWPDTGAVDTGYFPARHEAEDYLRRNGGGEMRRFKREGAHCCSTTMDPIRIDAPERVSFRDPGGRLHRWHAVISEAKDGRLIVTRTTADGRSYGSTTRRPGQYFVAPESIIRREAVAA